MAIFNKLFPSEQSKLKTNVEELQKEIVALTNRRDNLLKEIQKFKDEYDEVLDDLEVKKKEVEKKKMMIESFDDAQLQLMRHQIIDEIYKQATFFESSVLRDIRENFDKYSLEEIKSILTPSKYAHFGSVFDFMETIILPQYTFISIADKYLKLCVKDLTKQMKSLDWETLRVQIVSIIKEVEICGMHHNVEIPKQFEEDLFQMLD